MTNVGDLFCLEIPGHLLKITALFQSCSVCLVLNAGVFQKAVGLLGGTLPHGTERAGDWGVSESQAGY